MQIKHFSKEPWAAVPGENTIIKLDGKSKLDRVTVETRRGKVEIYVDDDGLLRLRSCLASSLEIRPIVNSEIAIKVSKR